MTFNNSKVIQKYIKDISNPVEAKLKYFFTEETIYYKGYFIYLRRQN